MHYQHRYHAGNFADVLKHLALCSLLQHLGRKPKPWFYLDTHAGAGLYDLRDEAAQRTAEFRDGIGRLDDVTEAPAPVLEYLQAVRACRGDAAQAYPGSPLLALHRARAGDRLAFCEPVAPVCAELRAVVQAHSGAGLAAVHERDGYGAHGLLPPPEKRGLVLVDPPYERSDEYEAVSEFALQALTRFSTAILALWYPVKNQHLASGFRRRLALRLNRPALDLRLAVGPPRDGVMRACGLVVINPPYGFAADMAAALPWLAPRLALEPGHGQELSWLKREEELR